MIVQAVLAAAPKRKHQQRLSSIELLRLQLSDIWSLHLWLVCAVQAVCEAALCPQLSHLQWGDEEPFLGGLGRVVFPWLGVDLLVLSQHLLSSPCKQPLSLHQLRLPWGKTNKQQQKTHHRLWKHLAYLSIRKLWCQGCMQEAFPVPHLTIFRKYGDLYLFHVLYFKVQGWECLSNVLLGICLAGIWWFHLHLLCHGNGLKDGGPGDLWQEMLPWRYLEPPGFLHCHGWVGQ